MLLFSALFSALAMWATAWWLTRHETTFRLLPLVWISLGIYLVSYLLVHWLQTIGVGLSLVALLLALMFICGLSWHRAALVTIVWLAAQIAFVYLIAPLY